MVIATMLVGGCGDGGGQAASDTAAPPAASGKPPGTSGSAAPGPGAPPGGGAASGGASGGSNGDATGGAGDGPTGGANGGANGGATGDVDGGSTGDANGGSTGDADDGSAGDADDGSAGDADGGSASANRSPTIGGTPQTMVLHDYRYSFTPESADADGDVLTFAIEGLPSWASFDTSTGRLSGTPKPADVGNYTNVRISVSDGKATAALAPFTIAVVATAQGSAALSWLPPTANTDGSALTNLAGYRVYWGPAPGNYEKAAAVDNPGVAAHVVAPLTPGTWYFVVTAVNAEGVESAYSNMASKTIQ